MDITCQNCGESIIVTNGELLRYFTRDAMENEPRAFLIIESVGNASSLLHRCDLKVDADVGPAQRRVLDSRVHQACGMISVQAGCTCRNAIALLEARANGTDQTVEAVVAAVLERRTSFA